MITIADTIGQLGLTWPRTSKIECPLHSDRDPSLHLYEDEGGGHFHCFQCGAHGGPRAFHHLMTGQWPPQEADSLFGRSQATANVDVGRLRRSGHERLRRLSLRFFEELRCLGASKEDVLRWADEFQTYTHDLYELSAAEADELLSRLDGVLEDRLETARRVAELQSQIPVSVATGDGRVSRSAVRPAVRFAGRHRRVGVSRDPAAGEVPAPGVEAT